MVDSVLASHLGVAGSSYQHRHKQLSLRARRTSSTSRVLDEFATSSPGVDPALVSNLTAQAGSGLLLEPHRSRSSTGLSAKDSSERPRVARLHSQLTAAALRMKYGHFKCCCVFREHNVFHREYEY